MESREPPACSRGEPAPYVHVSGGRRGFQIQLPVASHLSGRGTVDRKDGATRFTEIVLRSRLTLPKGADPERARRMLEKGKNACLVTASLLVPLRLEAELVVEFRPGAGPT